MRLAKVSVLFVTLIFGCKGMDLSGLNFCKHVSNPKTDDLLKRLMREEQDLKDRLRENKISETELFEAQKLLKIYKRGFKVWKRGEKNPAMQERLKQSWDESAKQLQ